ncbi:hypothetical protein K435DRAFT_802775 [Dendrothele bispora CBS 962.96]|uniref:HNH nuclease domain-containing protein n=1 Tax=Dendrothele bispora (strain CBS 962.96) TaxID=1314807 RepID=A0A4S8LJI8_DENBC|nr:hypothetical protein K435DRAFT_802775 [Dendrothele bispora CBS 962.96]
MSLNCGDQNNAPGVSRYASESSLTSLDSDVDTAVGGNHEEWVPLEPPTTDSKHVLLTVWKSQGYQVVLKFTVKFVKSLAYKPVKWLGYAAWCLHGFDGTIVDNEGRRVHLETKNLAPGMHYYFKPSRNETRAHEISATINSKPMLAHCDATSSETTMSNISAYSFNIDVKARDGGCVFTSYPPESSHASHLIPKWIGDHVLIELQRFRGAFLAHKVDEMESISDRRNGITLTETIDYHFNANDLSILATPNPYIECNDLKEADPKHVKEVSRKRKKEVIRKRKRKEEEEEEKEEEEEEEEKEEKERQHFPRGRQYTLHWFDWSLGTSYGREIDAAHCARAAFHEHMSNNELPLPNVCHYRYAVALLINCLDDSATVLPPGATDRHEDEGDDEGDYEEQERVQGREAGNEQLALQVQSMFNFQHQALARTSENEQC